jgi:hypothetical protein
LHDRIERLPDTHRYEVTEFDWRVVLLFTRTHSCVFRPGLAQIVSAVPPTDNLFGQRFDELETATHDWMVQANLTA